MATVAHSLREFPEVRPEDPRFRPLRADELLARSRTGDHDAAHGLIARYQNLIYALAWRLTSDPHDAAELVSEAYVRVFSVLPTCRNADTLPGWIARITTRIFYRQYRERQRRDSSLDALVEAEGDARLPVTDDDPARQVMTAFEDDERRQRLGRAVCSLPLPYRSIVVRFYVNEQSGEEIARQTGLTVNTVKSRLFRARIMLRRKLADLAG